MIRSTAKATLKNRLELIHVLSEVAIKGISEKNILTFCLKLIAMTQGVYGMVKAA